MTTGDSSARFRDPRGLSPRTSAVFALVTASFGAFGTFGCGDEAGVSDDSGSGAGGTGGTTASAGTSGGGTGGRASAGAGGVAGNAGSTGGGKGGMSAAGGSFGGGAGKAGSSGGGAGGSLAGASGAGSSSGGQSGAGASPGGSGGNAAGGAGAGAGGTSGDAGMAGAPNLDACKSLEVPTPPSEMAETIDITWQEMSGEFSNLQGGRGRNRAIQTYPSWALDHVMWAGGELNFCVRWDSEEPVSETLRDQIESTLGRGVNAWFSALAGYDCFPYPEIAVKVTGWAVRNRATLQWSDDSVVPIYVNQLSEGAPTCPATCSRFAHQDPDYDFASCPGGAANRFDQFVWLEEDYNQPNGWDMGCHLNREGFTNTVSGTGLYHIWLHEFGHSIGFPDYYDWATWAPGVPAPACVMNAGAAARVTDWDKWMFKRTWSELLRDDRWP